MKIFQTIVLVISVIALTLSFSAIFISQQADTSPLKGLEMEPNAYSDPSSTSTIEVGLDSPVEIIPRATSSRSLAKACNLDSGTVWTYKNTTSTGVVANAGIPISSSTAFDTCLTLDDDDPYQGAVWAIATDATSTVTTEFNQE